MSSRQQRRRRREVSRLRPAGADRSGSGSGAFAGTVVHLENLGSEAFVHIGSVGMNAPVVARVNDPSQLPAIGAPVGIWLCAAMRSAPSMPAASAS